MEFTTLKKVLIVGGIILAVVLITLAGLNGEKNGKAILSSLMQTGEFAIGAVRSSKTNAKQLPYNYQINGRKYTGLWSSVWNQYTLGKSYNYLWLWDSDENGNFLVIYDPATPKEKSLVRLDCPIKDSADFRQYVKTITEMREKGEATIGKLIPGGISE